MFAGARNRKSQPTTIWEDREGWEEFSGRKLKSVKSPFFLNVNIKNKLNKWFRFYKL